jgi:hypothetical protein
MEYINGYNEPHYMINHFIPGNFSVPKIYFLPDENYNECYKYQMFKQNIIIIMDDFEVQ